MSTTAFSRPATLATLGTLSIGTPASGGGPLAIPAENAPFRVPVPCSRRQFLADIVHATAAVTFTAQASGLEPASTRVPATVGSFTGIDAHVHFYDPGRPQGVPWPPREEKLLYRQVLPGDYRALPVPRPVAGTIVVEASPWLEDNQWVLDLAAKDPFIVGFVGNLPVGMSDFSSSLKRFARNPLFRGVRMRDRKLEGTLDETSFMNDLKLLVEHDLSLDLVGKSEILPFANRLAKELPRLRIIIDHLAGLTVDGKAPPKDWLEQMKVVAQRPNVYCKLSGLVEGTGRTDGSAPHEVEFYRPVLDALRTFIGPDRLIYASNWPVSEKFAPLATVQSIVGDYFRSHGPEAEKKVFSLTAKTAYRWLQRTQLR